MSKHCSNCGAELNNSSSTCTYCGNSNPNYTEKKTQAHASMSKQTTPTKKNNKSKLPLIILIVVIGFFVLNKFNLNPLTTNNTLKIDLNNIQETIDNTPSVTDDGNFYMAIDDTFSLAKTGVVVTGKVLSGSIKVGDKVTLLSTKKGEREVTIAGIEMYRKTLEEANVGDTVGIQFNEIDYHDVTTGDVLATPSSVKQHKIFKAAIYLLPLETIDMKDINNRFDGTYYFNNMDCTGRIEIKGNKLEAGNASRDITITLTNPTAMKKGFTFDIKTNGMTIGKGIVLDFED